MLRVTDVDLSRSVVCLMSIIKPEAPCEFRRCKKKVILFGSIFNSFLSTFLLGKGWHVIFSMWIVIVVLTYVERSRVLVVNIHTHKWHLWMWISSNFKFKWFWSFILFWFLILLVVKYTINPWAATSKSPVSLHVPCLVSTLS